MVHKVYGKVGGKEIILNLSGENLWQAIVPAVMDGQYVVEIIAEDEAGNQSYIARMLYTISVGDIRFSLLPPPKYLFCRQGSHFLENKSSIFKFKQLYPAERSVTV